MSKTVDRSTRARKAKTWGFYLSLTTLPLVWFIIFYICVNLNSIIMSFQIYPDESNSAIWHWSLDNFAQMATPTNWLDIVNSLKNSATAFAFRVLVGMTGGLVFSYYIFKKMPCHNLFKVILFLPTIVSSVVMVILYTLIVEDAIPFLMTGRFGSPGLLSRTDTKFTAALIYNIYVGFGTQVLMYLGAMNNVSDGALEAAKIDGANAVQEFFHVVFPGIYSTFMVFVTVSVVEFFTNNMSLHTFYGFKELNSSTNYTLGYLMYRYVGLANSNPKNLTYPAALGIVCTVIAIPFTVFVRWLLRKVGPSEE